jgi:hypothetical protein
LNYFESGKQKREKSRFKRSEKKRLQIVFIIPQYSLAHLEEEW